VYFSPRFQRGLLAFWPDDQKLFVSTDNESVAGQFQLTVVLAYAKLEMPQVALHLSGVCWRLFKNHHSRVLESQGAGPSKLFSARDQRPIEPVGLAETRSAGDSRQITSMHSVYPVVAVSGQANIN
jgi:hypothetical protein